MGTEPQGSVSFFIVIPDIFIVIPALTSVRAGSGGDLLANPALAYKNILFSFHTRVKSAFCPATLETGLFFFKFGGNKNAGLPQRYVYNV
ncbi:hypothetical protein B7994_06770 [Fibrobacter sp. UWR2]|nr:hypothetical protein B7994_06770 [Fibrobacter sp. UWR2]